MHPKRVAVPSLRPVGEASEQASFALARLSHHTLPQTRPP